MEIREYASGKFQVWKDNEVLRPNTLDWEGCHNSNHLFMYFNSLSAAKKAAKKVITKEEGEKCIKTHSI